MRRYELGDFEWAVIELRSVSEPDAPHLRFWVTCSEDPVWSESRVQRRKSFSCEDDVGGIDIFIEPASLL